MNKYAIYHVVDSPYSFPVSGNEMVIRLRVAKDDVETVVLCYESKYIIGEKQRFAAMTKKYRGKLFDYFEVKIKMEDTRLAYVFYITDKNGESLFFSEDGLTKAYDYTLGYYNFFQYPYINDADIHKVVKWAQNARFYQIFVDRFNIGNKEKDLSYVNMKWGEKPTPKSFAGGDLKGIAEKLDYIKDQAGANAIYLTPIFESISNHKYDISDYYNVDQQFGTNADLKELVKKAHEKGMRVVLDAVFNHCSEQMTEFKDVKEKGRDSKYYDWFVIHGERPEKNPCNYETFASCSYMPKFNTSNKECAEYLINVAIHYINEYDIDGWRLDVSDEISHDFWRQFRKAVKHAKEDAVILGENWHDANVYLKGDQYDGIMNYAFSKVCLDLLAGESFEAEEAAERLNDILMRNSEPVNSMMMNLLDSHDTHRFLTRMGGSIFKTKSALAMLYLFPGSPCIFYGTEMLIEGGFDPDCRKCMPWEKEEEPKVKDMRSFIQKLANIRKLYDWSKGETSIFSENEKVVFVITFSEECVKLEISAAALEVTAGKKSIISLRKEEE